MRTRYVLPVLTVASALALSGCVDNSQPAATGPASASGTAAAVDVKKNDSIAASLPEKIKSAGVLNVGMANNYPPNEFKDDMGMSSFTDTKEREKQVDFLNYYSAGIQWAAPKGKTVDPNNACGLKVAVQATTYEDTDEVPKKSKACTDAGKPAIQIFKFDAQDQATNALAVGQVDAMSADSPVTLYAISKTKDKLQTAGDAFEVAPYGIPVAKGSDFTPVLQKALQSLIDDGTYTKILSKWGVEAGGIKTAALNVAAKG